MTPFLQFGKSPTNSGCIDFGGLLFALTGGGHSYQTHETFYASTTQLDAQAASTEVTIFSVANLFLVFLLHAEVLSDRAE